MVLLIDYPHCIVLVTPIEEVLLCWPGLNRGIARHVIGRKWGGRSALDKSNSNLHRSVMLSTKAAWWVFQKHIASPYNKYLTSFHFEGRYSVFIKSNHFCMWKHRILHITPHAYLCHFCFELASQLARAGHLAQQCTGSNSSQLGRDK